MANLKLEHIYKVYPNGTKAVNDVNLDIKDKEFIVLVGPSGCGKSTTLRMIAGLEEITTGELYIDDVRVNDMEPKDRDIAMVFQNYALYPHMTVYENMAFGLTLRHVPREEIHRRVIDAAKILGLTDYLDRKPKAMSGGQRQRVSLGRAILRNPKVMLLDEPLSNLDAKLRSQMRSEISKLHQKLQTTFIYVTHDQVEAMTLGTRVVVMKLGVIQQVDTPKNLYNFPKNKFVAGFIGTPQMNFFNVTLEKVREKVLIHFVDDPKTVLTASREDLLKIKNHYLDNKTVVTLGFRSEDASGEDTEGKENIVKATVSHFEELGNETLVYGDLNPSGEDSLSTGKTSIIFKAKNDHGWKAGDVIEVAVNIKKAHFFDGKTEETILPKLPEENVCEVKANNGELFLGENKLALPASISSKISSFEGDLRFPTRSVHLGKGPFKALIHRVEKVGDAELVYLKSGDTLFFAFSKEEREVGDFVSFDLDFETITFVDKKGDVLLHSLKAFDSLKASFTNFKTAYAKTKDEGMNDLRQKKIALAKENYEKKLASLKLEEERALEKAKEKEAPLSSFDFSHKLLEAKLLKKDKIKKAKEEYKSSSASLAKSHKQAIKDIKAKVHDEYASLKEKEKADYLAIKNTNKDRNVIRSAKDAYDIFKESFAATRLNDLNKRLDAEGFEYESNKSAIRGVFNKEKALAIDSFNSLKKDLLRRTNPEKALLKEYKKKERALYKEGQKAIENAGLLFYFEIGNVPLLLPEKIVTKVVEGLGTKIFTRPFRIEIPHEAYKLGEKGLSAKVLSPIDYGSEILFPILLKDGETVYVSSRSGLSLKEGEDISLLPTLSECEIFEDDMNIRLY